MNRRVSEIGTMSVMVVTAALWANGDPQDKPAQDKPKTPAEAFQSLSQEFTKAQQESFRARQTAKTKEEVQEAIKKAPKPEEFVPRFMEIAENNPKDSVALDSLLWVVQNGGGSPTVDKAIETLIGSHIESAKLQAAFLRMQPTPGMDKLARAVIEKSPHQPAQRQACIALAVSLKNRRQADEAEKFFQKILDEFADLDSLMQVVQNNASGPSGEKAIDLLVRDHVTSPAFGQAMQRLAGSQSLGIEKIYRAVIDKSDSRDLQGKAALGLGQLLKGQADTAETLKMLKAFDEARLKQYEGYYGADQVKQLLVLDTEAAFEEAESMLAKVVKDYADVSGPRGILSTAAEPDLNELRTLSPGKEVPEIENEDIDGETFKLSDYRGKVVMLDFWGHW